ncbi:hypothetical protein NPIL_244071 [Nephila pilipes]|uniref:Uncharacterized protein n=1 Tax=Nephila pilipes TaxID=299642 RepID=A0A8X6NIC1_NEPPI|nr:hypothetical protein NPIL_244071 [Nephila pilipes]
MKGLLGSQGASAWRIKITAGCGLCRGRQRPSHMCACFQAGYSGILIGLVVASSSSVSTLGIKCQEAERDQAARSQDVPRVGFLAFLDAHMTLGGRSSFSALAGIKGQEACGIDIRCRSSSVWVALVLSTIEPVLLGVGSAFLSQHFGDQENSGSGSLQGFKVGAGRIRLESDLLSARIFLGPQMLSEQFYGIGGSALSTFYNTGSKKAPKAGGSRPICRPKMRVSVQHFWSAQEDGVV